MSKELTTSEIADSLCCYVEHMERKAAIDLQSIIKEATGRECSLVEAMHFSRRCGQEGRDLLLRLSIAKLVLALRGEK